jgi:hypothetical protein
MLIAHARDWNFTMNSAADSGPFFHLASPTHSPILPTSQNPLSSSTNFHTGPTYNTIIIPTLALRAINASLAFIAVLVLIFDESGNDSFIAADVILLLTFMWNILMVARYYLRSSERWNRNQLNEKRNRLGDMGLMVGLILALSVGYFIFERRKWYYSGWSWFWGCSLGWIAV